MCFDKLHNAYYFSKLDLQAAYWSIPMNEEDKEFTVQSGKYEFNGMPFGLTNTVATFCALMARIFANCQWDYIVCFINDILIFTPNDFNLHLHQLKSVIKKSDQAKMKLKLSKCEFAKPQVEFLGHLICRDGLKMDPKKVDSIKRISYPTTKKDARSFLGMVGYYRSFIPDFAGIAAPLFNALQNNQPDLIRQTNDVKHTVDTLKQHLCQYPILQFPNFNEPFILETDASNTRIAAILMQLIDGNKIIIACASRTLPHAEKNYGVLEREALAIVYGIQYFRPYLFGRNFLVISDHDCVKHIQNFKNPQGRIVRWILQLQEYSFEVVYRSGKENLVADAF